MAVTYDSSAKNSVGQTSTVTVVCTFTVAAGAVLLAGINTTTNVSVSACTVNGTPMTQLGRTLHTSAASAVTLYGLTAAPSGVVSISANLVGGVAATMIIMGASYIGASGTNPFGTVISHSNSNVATTVMSLSTSTTDRVVAFGGGGNVFSFTSTLVTTRLTDGAHRESRWVDGAGTGADMSLSCSAVTTTNNLYWLGVNIAASVTAVASTAVGSLAMLGVGT